MGYLPHQQRVVDELAELTVKTDALRAFISSNPIFEGLDSSEQGRLRAQLVLMKGYGDILAERIDNF